MKKELEKRIITSFLLFFLLIFCIFVSWPIYLISVLVVCVVSLNEIVYLISIIEKNTSNKNLKKKWIPFRFISFLYIFLLFFIATASLYEEGVLFVFFILLICIFSDVGGYVIGKTIGGKKLTKISPKKTISGSIGSFFSSVTPLLLFNNFDQHEYSYSINNFLLCLELSLVCQLGDIFVSYIKRKAKVKDSGKFLPGHGGLLDRIDGIIFALPFAWFYLNGLNKYIEVLASTISQF
ncbi:MAG TPA: phosphatidate cytidylyltransferase [Candidatus Pelagibacter sp.]|jgi:phosphatidate cytidylyltransferase|nr:phosphatidate cytidylyltransferase [Candidatus Pelagibacter sp.]